MRKFNRFIRFYTAFNIIGRTRIVVPFGAISASEVGEAAILGVLFPTGAQAVSVTGAPVVIPRIVLLGAVSASETGAPDFLGVLLPVGLVSLSKTGAPVLTPAEPIWSFSGTTVSTIPNSEGWGFSGTTVTSIPAA